MCANAVHYSPSLQLRRGDSTAPRMRLSHARMGLAAMPGTARGCWGLPGMRPVIEFAGDGWGLLGMLVIAQTDVPPPSNQISRPGRLHYN